MMHTYTNTYIQIQTHTYNTYTYIHCKISVHKGFLTRGSGRVRPRGATPPTQISLEGASDGTYVLHLPTGCVFAATEMRFDPLQLVF